MRLWGWRSYSVATRTKADIVRTTKAQTGTLLAELKVCTRARNIQKGRKLHAEAVQNGYHSCIYVSAALVSMYAKCWSMLDARHVFEGIRNPDVVLWTALILGYAENREGATALDLFEKMMSQGCAPNSVTFIAALKACTSLALDGNAKSECKRWGKHVHFKISSCCSAVSDMHVLNTLVDMYSKCGSMLDAQRVFDGMKHPDLVSWTALIIGYIENRKFVTALDLFIRMRSQGFVPTPSTSLSVLKACSSMALEREGSGRRECLDRAKEIHSQVSCDSDKYLQSTLIDMYSKCASMVDALLVFESIKDPDVVCWTALILGYVENGEGGTALNLFDRMTAVGCLPNSFTFVAVLKAFTSLAIRSNGNERSGYLELGKKMHSEVGCHKDLHVECTLIDMYAKFGSMVDARAVFDSIKSQNLVSWTALISGYAENGEGETALELFERMKYQGCAPDAITFAAAFKACGALALEQDENGRAHFLNLGKQMHSEMGCHAQLTVQNALIEMYAKCGSMVHAREVFESVERANVGSWNALILGYAENGESECALDLFANMRFQGCAPDVMTYVAALKACSHLGALQTGRNIHLELDSETANNSTIVTCLVGFYAKCGSLIEAQKVFKSQPDIKDVGAWAALLAGFSCLGDSENVFLVFQAMQDAGLQPSSATFLYVLTCCSHAGLVEKANNVFETIPSPTVEHYNCMVDLLCRSNKLDNALVVLQNMSTRPNSVTWMIVLDACRKWKNVEIGRLAFNSLVNSNNKRSASAHVLMSHIYESRDRDF